MAPDDPLLRLVASAVQENIQIRHEHKQAIEGLRAQVEDRLVAAETTHSWVVIARLTAIEAAAKISDESCPMFPSAEGFACSDGSA
jgi:hypothetical protein